MRDIETLQNPFASQPNSSPTHQSLGIAVFIMSHPLLDRMGHYYFHPLNSSSNHFAVNRTEPQFLPSQMPLADPYINRTALDISYKNQTVNITKQTDKLELMVNGQIVSENITLPQIQLTQGVVLQLNQRVCLLIKLCPPVEPIDHQRFLMHGQSHSLNQLCQHIAFLSPTNEPVLIKGATGTGKELVARAIVNNSPRHNKPFISVNLAAISPSLAAAELFGSSKGAYTGAQKQRNGFMQAADGGTLFLDEIGEANSEVQAMLLRVLETGELFPVGSTEPIQVDVRIIAATDAKLDLMIEKGDFKAPLLYRLANFELNLINLSHRKQDIPLLFVHFAHTICQELHITPPQNLLAPSWLPSHVMQQLLDYHWPGNIRELRNVVRQMIISSNSNPTLAVTTEFANKINQAQCAPSTEPSTETVKIHKRKPATIDKNELFKALEQSDYEVSKTADLLNISRASVYLLIKQHKVPSITDITDKQIHQLLAQQLDVISMAKQLQVSQSALRRRVNQLKAK